MNQRSGTHPSHQSTSPITSASEQQIQALGTELLSALRETAASRSVAEQWMERLLTGLMENERFRVQALRFVDLLPALSDDLDLVHHLREYFTKDDLALLGLGRWDLPSSDEGITSRLIAKAVRISMLSMARRFMGGSDAGEVFKSARKLRQRGMNFSIDLLGEETVSEVEAVEYQQAYLALIGQLKGRVDKWDEVSLLDRSNRRYSPRQSLSLKVSSLYSQLTCLDPEGGIEALSERLRPILLKARRNGAFVTIDMEQYESKEITLGVFRELLMEPELRDWADVGIAIQSYLRDAEQTIHELIEWARERGAPVTVRLVRGAYWDYETVVASQQHWSVPVWGTKWQTDRCFERCVQLLMQHHPTIETAMRGVAIFAEACFGHPRRSLPLSTTNRQTASTIAD
ncbi:proline dehydrogenase family protein [Solemya pervernicosa gill symbiont]|uniref:proline dehydrogenase family protein n=1 Tax=Solemya pervernicosa gill symbiont TaxID=642797 RepID=UPI0009963A7F|nr:proline dehydrogenase family protein [Solemya pervernicosa gill symbiont]